MHGIRTIPLDQLRFGHECLHGDVNIRTPGTDCAPLADSIRREGLLQPLAVWSPNGESPYFVIAGGRRLMALRYIHEDANPRVPVPCLLIAAETAADALAKSLVTEDTHLPPHPVDRFETFRRLADRGLDAAAIAARFGIDPRLVRQSLALGALAPEVRVAWRAGEIDQPAAQCFTLAENPAQQVKVLDRLRKKFTSPAEAGKSHDPALHIDATTIRKQFTGSEAEAQRLLKFVTRSAYVDAGGALSEDLFTSAIVIHDFAKLKHLAEEKLEAEAARLKADGWSFTETALTQRHYYGGRVRPKPQYTEDERARVAALTQRERELDKTRKLPGGGTAQIWQQEREIGEELERLESAAALRAFTPAQKAKLGCAVSLDHVGELDIIHGIPKPAAESHPSPETAPKRNGASRTATAAPAESFDAESVIVDTLTKATATALAEDETLALAAWLAQIQTGEGPFCIGYHADEGPEFVLGADSFDEAFEVLKKRKLPELRKMLHDAITAAVDDKEPLTALAAAVDQPTLTAAIAAGFAAKPYFDGCSKPWLLDIIEEALGTDERRRNEKKEKGALAKFCLDSVTPTGWLPTPLRTTLYVSPSASRTGPLAAPTSTAKKRGRPPGKAKPKPSTRAKRAVAKAFAP